MDDLLHSLKIVYEDKIIKLRVYVDYYAILYDAAGEKIKVGTKFNCDPGPRFRYRFIHRGTYNLKFRKEMRSKLSALAAPALAKIKTLYTTKGIFAGVASCKLQLDNIAAVKIKLYRKKDSDSSDECTDDCEDGYYKDYDKDL